MDEAAEPEGLPLSRFAWLLALGILGLAGLISLGVGGIGLVHTSAFPASRIRETPTSRADVRHGSDAPPGTTVGSLSAGVHAGKGRARTAAERPAFSARVTERRASPRETPRP